MFVHIPRTGGTSLLQVFRMWYGDKLLTVYERGKDVSGEYDIAYGHFYLDDMDYIVFLREPYQQQLSYYNYSVRYTNMPSVDDFFKKEVSTMTKFLPPDDKISFVGIYERYEDDVVRLADYLGMRHIIPNKTNTSKYKHYPSDESVEIFKENNKYIYDLYNLYL